MTFTDTPREVAGRLSPRFEATVDEVLDTPLMLIGTPDGMAEQLQRRRERWGYSYIVVPGPMARAFAGVAARLAGT